MRKLLDRVKELFSEYGIEIDLIYDKNPVAYIDESKRRKY